jgi:hypothetical protein
VPRTSICAPPHPPRRCRPCPLRRFMPRDDASVSQWPVSARSRWADSGGADVEAPPPVSQVGALRRHPLVWEPACPRTGGRGGSTRRDVPERHRPQPSPFGPSSIARKPGSGRPKGVPSSRNRVAGRAHLEQMAAASRARTLAWASEERALRSVRNVSAAQGAGQCTR